MRAYYYENGTMVENDSIEDYDVADDWFEDSYNYHYGMFPANEQRNNFKRGCRVLVRDGKLIMEWFLNK